MRFFGKTDPAPFSAGVALLALVGQASITPEQVDAANTELSTAGLTGAQLVPSATLDELTATAGRVETAEAAVKGYTDSLAAAGAADVAALVAQRDAYKVKADKLDALPGASHTTPTLVPGATDLDKGEPDADQKTIDELPHNKALAGHPLFG